MDGAHDDWDIVMDEEVLIRTGARQNKISAKTST